eukprot:TRINITY_DN1771_c0_g1_i4.p1 TRINITY_DN1771_c0_g1~~TRINITY_DN1771_c0_g1_i4.p1  ORF type:complete len:309 (-),score=60.84 TRINITY_DN1771_c0_g1_i4:141-1067(-)
MYVLRVFTRYLLGDTIIKKYDHDHICDLFYDLEVTGMKPATLLWPKCPIGPAAECQKIKAELMQIISDAVQYYQDKLEDKNEIGGYDTYTQVALCRFVVAASKDEIKPLTLEYHLLSMVFAGHINAAGTTAWGICHLANDPQSAKILAERDEKERKSLEERAPKLESDFAHWHSAMYETLRMYASSALVPRTIQKDIRIAGVDVRKGTMIAVNQSVTCSAKVDNPERWDPKRFESGKAKELLEKREFLPFGLGTHSCRGINAVRILSKSLWMKIVQDYELTLQGKFPKPDTRPTGIDISESFITIQKR